MCAHPEGSGADLHYAWAPADHSSCSGSHSDAAGVLLGPYRRSFTRLVITAVGYPGAHCRCYCATSAPVTPSVLTSPCASWTLTLVGCCLVRGRCRPWWAPPRQTTSWLAISALWILLTTMVAVAAVASLSRSDLGPHRWSVTTHVKVFVVITLVATSIGMGLVDASEGVALPIAHYLLCCRCITPTYTNQYKHGLLHQQKYEWSSSCKCKRDDRGSIRSK